MEKFEKNNRIDLIEFINPIDLMKEIPDGIIVLDKDLNTVFINEEALKLFNCTRESILGKNFNKLDLNQGEPKVKEAFINCIKDKKPVKNKYYINYNNCYNSVFIKSKNINISDENFTILSISDVSSISECSVELNNNESKVKFLGQTIIGKDEKILDLFKMIELASESMANVLITGESGTGKELVARAIHELSERKDKSFVTVNCSSLSESLLESELFGHVKGSFTGAYKDKIGKFEIAESGTIFLDEIGDISPLIQLKLLRVIQEKTIIKVGDNNEIKVDMRIICATNKNLRDLITKGDFREDLFYRLNVFQIQTAPLRERYKDIPLLCEYFINQFNFKLGKRIKNFSDDALRLMLDYCWPGNVRELQNAIEHAFVVCNKELIDIFDLPQELRQSAFRDKVCKGKEIVIEKKEINAKVENEMPENKGIKARNTITKEKLFELLNSNNGNKAETARQLGISRIALWKKIKKFSIE